ncbi:hypothetical protein DFH08DRAFT_1087513 [Mycena albidolilacea]|uniref:Uncharacterized protein n=1 Tax=Mycena albidolilacea TaxID=1033008 RepID=A0AAD6Z9J9_9AGAR|nr:hypothetical protein DFH08DRAFT_1087513 [Mycena albidolilacea]
MGTTHAGSLRRNSAGLCCLEPLRASPLYIQCPPVAYASPALVDPPSGVGLHGRPFAEPHRATPRRSPVALPLSSPRSHNPTIPLTDDTLAAVRRGRNSACLGYCPIRVILPDPLLRLPARILTGDETFPRCESCSLALKRTSTASTTTPRARAQPRAILARRPNVAPLWHPHCPAQSPLSSSHLGGTHRRIADRGITICASNAIHRARCPMHPAAGCAPPSPAHPHSRPSRLAETAGARAQWATPLPSPSPPLPAFVHPYSPRSTPIAHGRSLNGEYSDGNGTARTDARARASRDKPSATEERHYAVANWQYGRREREPHSAHEGGRNSGEGEG